MMQGIVQVPEGISGDWQVLKYKPKGLEKHGLYTKLMCGETLFMADTPCEVEDHKPLLENATGNVLVMGLGIGLTLELLFQKVDVDYVHVIEKSQEVIDIVSPYYLEKYKDKVSIIHADALELHPFGEWNAIWVDIWSDISINNKQQYDLMRERWTPYTNWIGLWAEDKL